MVCKEGVFVIPAHARHLLAVHSTLYIQSLYINVLSEGLFLVNAC